MSLRYPIRFTIPPSARVQISTRIPSSITRFGGILKVVQQRPRHAFRAGHQEYRSTVLVHLRSVVRSGASLGDSDDQAVGT